MAITVITPRLKEWLKGFSLDLETLQLRDKDYVAIKSLPRDALIQYFIAKSSVKGAIKYKTKSRFILYMFISRATFLAIEDYREQADEHRGLFSSISTSIASHQVPESSKPRKIKSRKQKGKQAIRSDKADSDDSSESIDLPDPSDLIKVRILY